MDGVQQAEAQTGSPDLCGKTQASGIRRRVLDSGGGGVRLDMLALVPGLLLSCQILPPDGDSFPYVGAHD